MNAKVLKAVRAAIGIVVLLVLALTVRGWWREYRKATDSIEQPRSTQPSAEATGTAPAEEAREGEAAVEDATPSVEGESGVVGTVTVLIDGLNFRSAPRPSARPHRGLGKGETLQLISEREGWYEVRDEDGTTGWVSTNPNYTRVERR